MSTSSSFPQNGNWPIGRDLYLQWALLTDFRFVVTANDDPVDADTPVQLLLECTGTLRKQLLAEACNQPSNAVPPSVSAHHLFDDTYGPKHQKTSVFSVSAPLYQVREWMTQQDVVRLEMSAARKAPALDVPSASAASGERGNGLPAKPPKRIAGTRVVMAIIDDGLPFLHERFRRATDRAQSRVAYFWDQTPEKTRKLASDRAKGTGPVPGSAWQPVYRFGYGRELSSAEIDGLIAQGGSETDTYARLDYDRVAPQFTHGSHVADLAAGGVGRDDIPLILVQLPGPVVQDTSGGGTAKHVADALLYILDRVDDDVSVVVNLSFGTNAGPHDGSTLLERAMDAISIEQQKRRGFLVVLPAGNAFNSQGHGQVSLTKGQMQELHWNVRFDDPTDTFCDLWWPKDHWHDLKVTLVDPSGHQTDWSPQKPTSITQTGTAITCAVLGTPVSTAANDKAHILMALAPTSRNGQSPRAQPGIWRIRLTNTSKQPFGVDAWIQRDDSPMNTSGAARQSFFLSTQGTLAADEDDAPTNSVKRMGTGNSLAHGRHTVVVGGLIRSEDNLNGYTAAALHAGKWPDALAPTDDSTVQPGVEAAGTCSGERFRMNGTSVAAPQVTRLIAEHWAKGHQQKTKQDVLSAVYGNNRLPTPVSTISQARTGTGRRLR